MKVSVVVPAYDEQDSLAQLCEETVAAVAPLCDDWELIFVDDGSSDATFERIADLARSYSQVRGIRLSRNFGKSAAYRVGFDAADGDFVITLDGDLQDDPAEIPKLLAKLEEGHDLVAGWKQARMGNEPQKALPSRLFNLLLSWLFGLALHDSNCGFRAMRRAVAKNLDLHGGSYRFIPELAHVTGYRVAEVKVQHRLRAHGRSKYGPGRFWTGLVDMLAVRFVTAFRQRPLQFFGTVALPLFLLGGGLEVYVLYMKLAVGEPFARHLAALITGVLLLLVGVQIFVTGLIGEMMVAGEKGHRYAVRESLGFEEPRKHESTRPPSLIAPPLPGAAERRADRG